jgi:FtsZ-binding cell division protein ZapB
MHSKEVNMQELEQKLQEAYEVIAVLQAQIAEQKQQ